MRTRLFIDEKHARSEAAISTLLDMAATQKVGTQPRARGAALLNTKTRDEHTVVSELRQQGSLKLLFPRDTRQALTGVLLNTAGGITGGDVFEATIAGAADTHTVLTTQAAERAYRAQPGEVGSLSTRLDLADGARLDWLPQETLLYDRAALDRSLSIRLGEGSTLLAVEPVILGRAAMGETVRELHFTDRIDLWAGAARIFADRTRLKGDATRRMAGVATGQDMAAMASLIYVAPDATRFLSPARALLPETGGISEVQPGLLFARILAPDGFELRRTLLPLINLFSITPLPRTWTI